MELLERESHLAELHDLLSRAAAGAGGLVLLGGEAGVGKTSLVRRFVMEAAGSARFLLGACDPLSTPRPLGPLHDVAGVAGGKLAALLRDGASREALFGASLRELTTAGGGTPTVLIVEDAHWADEATLDWVRYLGRRLGGSHALMVITYRDDEVGPRHPLRIALGDLESAGRPRRISLPRLSLTGLRRLAAGSDVDPVRLYDLTDGNPFFATEILASGGGGVPQTIQDAVLARAGRLGSGARSALEAAAVLGPPVDPAVLARVSAAGAAEIDECMDRGLLVTEAGGLGFRHELARQATYGDIPRTRLIELHRAALAALIERGARGTNLARIAHHAEEAGDSDAVMEYAPRAAEHARALRANREAAAQYARALRFAGGLPVEQRFDLLWGWFHACYDTGALSDARSALTSLLEIALELGDSAKEAVVRSWMAAILVHDGRNAEAEAESVAALALLEDREPGPAHAVAYRFQGSMRMLDRDCAVAIQWGDRTIELAERFGDAESALAAYNFRGSAKILIGRTEEGIADLERSMAIATEGGHDAGIANAYNNLGSASGEVYKLELAEGYLVDGMDFSKQRDLDGYRYYCEAWLALVRCYQGRWSESTMHSEAVLRRPNATAIAHMMAWIAVGRVRARRGDPEVAAALDAALELAGPTRTLQRVGPLRAVRAEAAWLAGDRDRATGEAAAAYQIALDHRHPWLIGELAFWLWRGGALTKPVLEAAEPYRLQIAGDWRGAAAAWEEIGCPYEAARARADADDEATLRGALAVFEGLGARPAAAAVVRRLRAIGATTIPRGPRPQTRSNPAHLTTREAEVAGLVGQGLSNGQIAERLFLSPKTVERHVSAILTKLDVRSRADVGRVMASLEPRTEVEGELGPT